MTELPTGTRMQPWLEQAWLDRYLANQLTQTEADWFEAYMLDKTDLAEIIDQDTDLRDGLRDQSQSDPARHPHRSAPFPSRALSSDRHVRGARSARMTRFAVAASLLLALTAGWLGRSHFGSDPTLESAVSPTRVVFDTLRGEPAAPQVEPGTPGAQVVLVEVAVPPDASMITLHIQGIPDRALSPSSDGFVSFIANRDMLAARRATLDITVAGHGTTSRALDVDPRRIP